MNEGALRQYLRDTYPRENDSCEWKEFKSLKHSVTGDKGADVASYVSAIANMQGGHLVIGVQDKTLEIVGIQDFHDYTPENLRQRLVGRCVNLDSEGCKVEAFTTSDTCKTVWVLHIPRHRARLPVYAHDKAWQRLDDALVEMRPERLDAILAESAVQLDHSAEIIETATLADLDSEAIGLARRKFQEKHQNAGYASEIADWDDATFLDKAKVTIRGRVTRTALLLLGKRESSHLLLGGAQITWKLVGEEIAYEHFELPFLINTTKVLQRIRNVGYKLFPQNQLLAIEVNKYDQRVILEALHNCIAHQDYSFGSKIVVTEKIDRLVFENSGGFFDGDPEEYFAGEKTPSRYRNPWLAQAMVALNMIDTVGFGIRTMAMSQRDRFFPLPDYSKSGATKVVLEIYGHVIDENYTRLLMEQRDLPLETVMLLDRIQKKYPITDAAASALRRAGLIEGRKPNYFLASGLAHNVLDRTEYIHNRAFDDAYYKDIILRYLSKYESASREDIDRLLLDKLPSILDPKQKHNKVRNLLYSLSKREKIIEKQGSSQLGRWVLTPLGQDKVRQA